MAYLEMMQTYGYTAGYYYRQPAGTCQIKIKMFRFSDLFIFMFPSTNEKSINTLSKNHMIAWESPLNQPLLHSFVCHVNHDGEKYVWPNDQKLLDDSE